LFKDILREHELSEQYILLKLTGMSRMQIEGGRLDPTTA
jgi:hypothetical protein